ncbi:hypothetical protein BH11PLA1_BH11PLA1_05430 [soil metagenome]
MTTQIQPEGSGLDGTRLSTLFQPSSYLHVPESPAQRPKGSEALRYFLILGLLTTVSLGAAFLAASCSGMIHPTDSPSAPTTRPAP